MKAVSSSSGVLLISSVDINSVMTANDVAPKVLENTLEVSRFENL